MFSDQADLNNTLHSNIFYIDNKHILHVVNEATCFYAAVFVSNFTSEPLWHALCQCWIDVYSGHPDVIAQNDGKNVLSEAFKLNADKLHTETKSIAVEAAHPMSNVERYHARPPRPFKVTEKESLEFDKEDILRKV